MSALKTLDHVRDSLVEHTGIKVSKDGDVELRIHTTEVPILDEADLSYEGNTGDIVIKTNVLKVGDAIVEETDNKWDDKMWERYRDKVIGACKLLTSIKSWDGISSVLGLLKIWSGK